MAFSVALQGVPRDMGARIWRVEPNWPEWELMADVRFRAIRDEETGYLDNVAVLSPPEARALAEKYRQPLHEQDETSKRKLDELLAQEPPDLCWVLVNVFEWESGL